MAGSAHGQGSPVPVDRELREKDRTYRVRYKLPVVGDAAAKTRTMPVVFREGSNNVSRKFIDYVTPRVGRLPVTERL